MDPGRAIGAVGARRGLAVILSASSASVQLPGRGDGLAALVVGGTGDLEQLTAALDAVACDFLRLDEGVHLHRVSFAKKAVARLSRSTSACSRRFSRRSRASSSRSSVVRPSRVAGVDLGLVDPGPHRRLGQVEVPGHLADRAVTAPGSARRSRP